MKLTIPESELVERPVICWMLELQRARQSWQFQALSAKGTVYLSPHTKPCDVGKAAMLATEEEARRIATGLATTVAQRHGQEAVLRVVPHRGPATKDDQARIQEHTALMLARVEQGIFAPNMRPRLPKDNP